MYNFYVYVLQSMWRITPKGYKEAKNIFNVKKSLDLGFDSQNIEKKEIGFEYFEDSVEVEVSQLGEVSQDKDQTFDESTENVKLTRNLKKEKIESPKSKTWPKKKKISRFNR